MPINDTFRRTYMQESCNRGEPSPQRKEEYPLAKSPNVMLDELLLSLIDTLGQCSNELNEERDRLKAMEQFRRNAETTGHLVDVLVRHWGKGRSKSFASSSDQVTFEAAGQAQTARASEQPQTEMQQDTPTSVHCPTGMVGGIDHRAEYLSKTDPSRHAHKL